MACKCKKCGIVMNIPKSHADLCYDCSCEDAEEIEFCEKELAELEISVKLTKMEDKKITLSLEGLDGNAFYLMGAFQKQARREGWSQEEINEVLTECKSGDYDHLLCTLMEHCEEEN